MRKWGSIVAATVFVLGVGTAAASSPVTVTTRKTQAGDTWQSIAVALAPGASPTNQTAFARLLAQENCGSTAAGSCDATSLITALQKGLVIEYTAADVPPATTTTTAAPTTTMAATTTTMGPMNMMPVVNASKIPGPAAGYIGPLEQAQQYPYQTSDGTGAFRITTHYSNFGYADPIAFPGGVSPHLHLFFGNTCVTATMTDPTTCGSSTSDGGTLNKTAYWVPAIIDSTGAPVTPSGMQVYYKTGYNGVRPQDVRPFPAGLKLVAGSAATTTPNPSPHDYDRIVNYDCNNSDGTSFNHIPTNAEGNAGGCAPGTWFVMEIEFPQCWDGVHLDSADHKSHMAYPTGAGCPADHPVALPEVTERVLYTMPAGGIPNGWRLASDNYAYNGSNAGYSGHADWFNGWDTATMQQIVTGCENVPRDCSMDLLGNGQMLYYPG